METCSSAGPRWCLKVVRNDPGDFSPGDQKVNQESKN